MSGSILTHRERVLGEIIYTGSLSKTVVTGMNVTLMCKTTLPKPVDWDIDTRVIKGRICSRGELINPYAERYGLANTTDRNYSLLIPNITQNDTGLYTCTEKSGLGPAVVYTLTVKKQELPTVGLLDTLTTDSGEKPTTTTASNHESRPNYTLIVLIIIPAIVFVICAVVAFKKRKGCRCKSTSDDEKKRKSPIFKGDSGYNSRLTTATKECSKLGKDDGAVSNEATNTCAMGEAGQELLLCGEDSGSCVPVALPVKSCK